MALPSKKIDPSPTQLESDSRLLLESAIESNLKMSYESRVDAHENARRLMEDLKQVGEKLRAKPQNPS